MTQDKRVRRVARLCCRCMRNFAYYEAGFVDTRFVAETKDFWITANGNFLDIGVLEWCKLFVDRGGKHHWKKVAADSDNFLSDLWHNTGINQDYFDCVREKVKKYRDKYVAHLDEAPTMMSIPILTVAKKSTVFLFEHLKEGYPEALKGFPLDLPYYYEGCLEEARMYYPDALAVPRS